MIFIKKHFKKLGIFILIELLLVFGTSLFNLIGVNSSLTKIIIFLANITIFFMYGYTEGKITKRKALTDGMINGLMLISVFFFISLLFFHKYFSLGTLFYYLTLWTVTIFSEIFGKNKKKEPTQD